MTNTGVCSRLSLSLSLSLSPLSSPVSGGAACHCSSRRTFLYLPILLLQCCQIERESKPEKESHVKPTLSPSPLPLSLYRSPALCLLTHYYYPPPLSLPPLTYVSYLPTYLPTYLARVVENGPCSHGTKIAGNDAWYTQAL
jgi:hypothetical protein